MRPTKLLSGVVVVLGLLFGMLTGVQPAQASSMTCDSNFGTKIPVLLVHGFDSNPGMWDTGGNSSMKAKIGQMSGVYVAKPFDYSNNHFDWVDEDAIAGNLAQTIDCLAQNSLHQGGAGKVIIVAHSMGGLATREALSKTVSGRNVADGVGLVITLGTPNTGAPLSDAATALHINQDLLPEMGLPWYCAFMMGGNPSHANGLGEGTEFTKCMNSSAITGMAMGSSQLQQLPRFPAQVPVRAIAGDVTITTQFLFGTSSLDTGSDIVVPVSSATNEFTSQGSGDGQFVFKCDLRHYDSYGSIPVINWPNYQGSQCWHMGLYTTGYIQQSVLNGISDYVTAHPVSQPSQPASFTLTAANTANLAPDSVTLFGKLNIRPGNGWDGVMSYPDAGYIGYADHTTCTADDAGCPHLVFLDMTNSQVSTNYGSDPLKRWSTDPSGSCTNITAIEGPVTVKIGGRDAQLYRQRCQNDPYAEPRYAWVIPGQLFVAITDFGGSGEIAEAALENATWK